MHLTCARFRYLKEHPDQVLPHEISALKATLTWERRSAAAFRAVKTKRQKYAIWPTRGRAYQATRCDTPRS